MVAAIKPAHRDHLHRHADQKRSGKRKNGTKHEATSPGRERRREVSTDHIERAVGQIDQVHNAED